MGTLIKKFQQSIWGQTLILLVGWNIGIRIIAAVGYLLLSQRFVPLEFIAETWKSNFLWWSLANFDGEHYLSIAKYGYQIRNGFPQYAFFPLFPLLIKVFSLITRDIYLAGLIVSQLSLWTALTYTMKWCKLLKLPNISRLLLLSTGAVFLASIYTEPLFIALSAICFYACEKKWWGKAALVAGLTTATRVNGLFLAIFIFIKMIKAKEKSLWVIAKTTLSLSGIILYMSYLKSKTGDALAWYHAQSAWGKADATSPVATLINYARSVTIDFTPDLTHLVVTIEVASVTTMVLLLIALLSHKMLDLAYWVYLTLNIALPIATGSLGSTPRFFLTVFPLLVVVPRLSRTTQTLYYTGSILAASIGIVLFTRGYWYG
jgi:hypothetical protein